MHLLGRWVWDEPLVQFLVEDLEFSLLRELSFQSNESDESDRKVVVATAKTNFLGRLLFGSFVLDASEELVKALLEFELDVKGERERRHFGRITAGAMGVASPASSSASLSRRSRRLILGWLLLQFACNSLLQIVFNSTNTLRESRVLRLMDCKLFSPRWLGNL